ncbi:PREDICTED: nucleolar complex protein 2 homolog [Priapulus caudatus]|uniref:Nucleolar complex protein 2 homolog n=1 Tax=Priapulus caudatus TaxID=37621 RepID=A0ABM1E118_PRICU|nr:PREDICTED: nucleolar complex protein 2 homolog [Priapulus caudatus]
MSATMRNAVKTRKTSKPPKRKLSDMKVADFMQKGLDTGSDDTSVDENDEEDFQSTSKGLIGLLDGSKSSANEAGMKTSMTRLQEKDPEFYKFLQDNDPDLLNFDVSDESSGDEDEARKDLHVPPTKLQVGSDESEEENSSSDEESPTHSSVKMDRSNVVTMKMISNWSSILQDTPSPKSILAVADAFRAAVQQAGGDTTQDDTMRVEGSNVFNAIVRMCMVDLVPAIYKVLNLPQPLERQQKKLMLPSSSKKWPKLKIGMKHYLTDLMQLFSQMSEPAVLHVVLKHVLIVLPFYICFPKTCKLLLKKLIRLWSTAEESVRVLSFLCLARLTNLAQEDYHELVIKQTYMAYVKNCKFTSPTTLPVINFMQRSMAELFRLDDQAAYQHAFVFIRQLAIHLRNAITTRKKESYKSVYNWQYVHCLAFWCRLLADMHPNNTVAPLVYPIVQTTIGCLKLIPTEKYYPLRFYCIKSLTLVSSATRSFIPILPFIMEVFEITDFNRKHSSMGFKPLNFSTTLKLTRPQLSEKGFRDGVVDQVYESLMEYLNVEAHTIGFPELVLPAVMQLKSFLKACKVANFCKPLKQILDKITENSNYINQRRKNVSFAVNDLNAVARWESQTQEEGTPLSKYYKTWRKLRDRELAHEISGKEQIVDQLHDTKIPYMKHKKEKLDKKEFSGLFPSESESDGEESEEELLKRFDPTKNDQKSRQKVTHS